MKCKPATIDRITRECSADIGQYRYNLVADPAGRAHIERRKIKRLNILDRYPPQWETVASYDPNADRWTIEK